MVLDLVQRSLALELVQRAPTEKVKDESDAVSLEAAPFACGVHAHSDYSVNLLAYAVNSYGLQSESQE